MKHLLLFLFFVSNASSAHDFTQDRRWLNLLRYQKKSKQFESLVTNSSWFFSPLGRTSPQQEAIATINSFKYSPSARCKFPARARYLLKKGLIKPEKIKCTDLNYIKKKLNLDKVNLVFAGYHINNPSSAFGHTLFKLRGSDQPNDYLNWGFNFSALQTTNNPLLYGLYGLSGKFKGKFSILPYFMKLKEYQDSENRDLWEYQLNLSPDELLYFVEHLWEMNSAEFDYYYLTKNCSYHLMAFLDAINPNWELTKLLDFFVIPSDTLKVLGQVKGLVSSVRFKPSPFKKLKQDYLGLKPKEKVLLKNIHKWAEQPESNFSELSTRALDFSIDYIDYLFEKSLKKHKQGPIHKLKRRVQLLRSKRDEAPKFELSEDATPPHLIHPASTIKVARKKSLFDRKLTAIELRASFDEYLDPHSLNENWSELVFGKVALSYHAKERDLRLDQFTILNVEANNQSLFSSFGSVWSLRFGIDDRPITRSYDLGPSLRTSYGFNYQFKRTLVRLLLPLSLHFSKRAQHPLRKEKLSLDSRLTGQILHRANERSSFILSTSLWNHTLLGKKLRILTKLDYRWHFKKPWAFDLSTTYRLKHLEYSLGVMRYF